MKIRELKRYILNLSDDVDVLLSTPGDLDYEYALDDLEIDDAIEYVILSGDRVIFHPEGR